MPSARDFLLSVNPGSPEWVIQLAELLHKGGAESNASLAASRAADLAGIPALGQGLQKVVEGLSDIRKINDLRLTPMQFETMESIFAEMVSDFSNTLIVFSNARKSS